jgi:hypothetical protein
VLGIVVGAATGTRQAWLRIMSETNGEEAEC